MAYKREEITGVDPLNLKKLNDNIRNLWSKVFGDINLTDIANDVKTELYTNWLQPQGEGNLDSSHPFYIRFYIPENTKKIKSGSINLMVSRYRLDSDIAQSSAANISISGVSMGQITTNSSGSSTATTTASGGGQTTTSSSGGGQTATSVGGGANSYTSSSGGSVYTSSGSSSSSTTGYPTGVSGSPTTDYADGSVGIHCHGMGVAGHSHGMSHTHDVSIGSHSHSVSTSNHTHDVTIYDHSHAITITDHMHNMEHYHDITHSHEIISNMLLPAHTHDINFGIKEAVTNPQGIRLIVNSQDLGIILDGDGAVSNNIDITSHLTIGWNILTITSSNIARITLYGIVEALQTFK